MAPRLHHHHRHLLLPFLPSLTSSPASSFPPSCRRTRRSSQLRCAPASASAAPRLHHLLPPLTSPPASSSPPSRRTRPGFQIRCSPASVDAPTTGSGERAPSFADGLLLGYFRRKMVEEVGWDSEKPGYAGLIEVANRLMIKGKSNYETEQSAVRVLRSLFPPLLLVLFKALLAPIANGEFASMMVARATALSCQWLMGPCSVNSVTLPNGKSCLSGVSVEKCKYLEESKCLGICINTCKLPTQTFFKDYMGVPLYMEPNFEDYSCQFNFGVLPPPLDADEALKEPCLDICKTARRRKELECSGLDVPKCPQV